MIYPFRYRSALLVFLLLTTCYGNVFSQGLQELIQQNQEEELREYLAKYPDSASIRLPSTLYPVHFAARENKANALEVILEFDSNTSYLFSYKDDRYTALYLALYNKAFTCVELLLAAGADTAFLSTTGESFYSFIDHLNNPAHFQVAKSRLFYWKQGIYMTRALEEEDFDKALEHLNKGADIDHIGSGGWNNLHLAIRDGKNARVDWLLKRGANVEIPGNEGFRPIHLATRNNRILFYDALIRKGAGSNAETDSFETPYALAERHQCEWILAYMADPEKTLFEYLECKKFWDQLRKGDSKKLSQWETRPDILNKKAEDRSSFLAQAIYGGDRKCIRWAMEHAPDLNARDIFGYSPINLALLRDDAYAYYHLFRAGADTSVETENYSSQYQLIATNPGERILLLTHLNGYYTLEEAIYCLKNKDKSSMQELFDDPGFDPTFQMPETRTSVVHWAAGFYHRELLLKCLEKDCDFFTSTSSGYLPVVQLAGSYDLELIDEVYRKLGRKKCFEIAGRELEKSKSGFVKAYPNSPSKTVTAYLFYKALSDTEPKKAKKLWRKKPDYSLPDENGMTAFHMAARQNMPDMFRAMIRDGANPFEPGTYTFSPAFLHAYNFHMDAVLDLLEQNPEWTRSNEFKVLCESGNMRELEWLRSDPERFEREHRNYQAGLSLLDDRKYESLRAHILRSGMDMAFRGNEGYTLLHAAVARKDSLAVLLLLQLGCPADSKGNSGKTPLSLAMQNDEEGIARLLVDYGADITLEDDNDKEPIDYCSTIPCYLLGLNLKDRLIGELTCNLVFLHLHLDELKSAQAAGAKCLNPDYINPDYGEALIHAAVQSENKQAISWVLAKGADINLFSRGTDSSYSPIMMAVSESSPQLIPYLLSFGADPYLKNVAGLNAFDLAGDLTEVRLLLQGDPSATQRVTLWSAVQEGDEAKALELLDNGTDPNTVFTNGGFTSLHYAARDNRPQLVFHLLAHGAENRQNASENTPLGLALYNGNLTCAWLLVKNGGTLTPADKELLKESEYLGKWSGLTEELLDDRFAGLSDKFPVNELKLLVINQDSLFMAFLKEEGTNLMVTDQYGWNVYHYAARHDLREVLNKLPVSHPFINAELREEALTPFHLAVINGYDSLAMDLLDRGADSSILAYDSLHWTDLAIMNERVELVVQILPDNPKVKEVQFWQAVYNADLSGIRKFLSADPQLAYVRNEYGFTPIMYACRNQDEKNIELFHLLMEKKPDLNIQNASGWTALMLALHNGNILQAYELLKAGANPSLLNDSLQNARDIAEDAEYAESRTFFENPAKSYANYMLIQGAMKGKLNMVRSGILEGADMEAKDIHGWTALAYAARDGHLEILEILGDAGADIDPELFANDYGRVSALWLALYNKHFTCAYWLVKKGASTDFIDGKGKKLQEIAAGAGEYFVLLLSDPDLAKHRTELSQLMEKALEYNSPVLVDEALYQGFQWEFPVGEYQRPALIQALYENNYEAVTSLLKRGADPNSSFEFSDGTFSAPELALIRNNEPAFLALVLNGAEFPSDPGRLIPFAGIESLEDDLEKIRRQPEAHRGWWDLLLNEDSASLAGFYFEHLADTFSRLTTLEKQRFREQMVRRKYDPGLTRNCLLPLQSEEQFGDMVNVAVDVFDPLYLSRLLIYGKRHDYALPDKVTSRVDYAKKHAVGYQLRNYDNPDYDRLAAEALRFFEAKAGTPVPEGIFGWLYRDTLSAEVLYLDVNRSERLPEFLLRENYWHNLNPNARELLVHFCIANHLDTDPLLARLQPGEKEEFLNLSLKHAILEKDTVTFSRVLTSAGQTDSLLNYTENTFSYRKNFLSLILKEESSRLFLPFIPENRLFREEWILDPNNPLESAYRDEDPLLLARLLPMAGSSLYRQGAEVHFIFSGLSAYPENSEDTTVQTVVYQFLKNEKTEDLEKLRYYSNWLEMEYDLLQYLVRYSSNTHVVAGLLNQGFVSNRRNNKGLTALDIAREEGKKLFEKMLLNPGNAELYLELDQVLRKSPELADLRKFQSILPYWQDQEQNGLLQIAIEQDNKKLFTDLLNSGIPFSNQNRKGYTYLHSLVAEDRQGWLKKEDLKPAMLAAKDFQGNTPLHLAIQERNEYFIRLLAGLSDKSLKNEEGETPELLAINQSCEACRLLLKNPEADVTPIAGYSFNIQINEAFDRHDYRKAYELAQQRSNSNRLWYGVKSEKYIEDYLEQNIFLAYSGNVVQSSLNHLEMGPVLREYYRNNPIELGKQLCELALSAHIANKHGQALLFAEESFSLLDKRSFSAGSKFPSLFEVIAEAYQEMGQPEQVKSVYRRFSPYLVQQAFDKHIEIALILEKSDLDELAAPHWNLVIQLYKSTPSRYIRSYPVALRYLYKHLREKEPELAEDLINRLRSMAEEEDTEELWSALGNTALQADQDSIAELAIEKVLAKRSSVKEKTFVDAGYLNKLCNLKFKRGQHAEAFRLAEKALDIHTQFIEDNFLYLQENERDLFVRNWTEPFQLYSAICIKLAPGDPSYLKKLLERENFIRGISLNSSSYLRRFASESEDPEVIGLRTRLNGFRKKKSDGMPGFSGLEDPVLRRLNDSIAHYELLLAQKGFSSFLRESARTTSYRALQQSLEEDEMYIQFVRTEEDSFYRYAAICVSSGKDPVLVDIGDEPAIRARLKLDETEGVNRHIQELYARRGAGYAGGSQDNSGLYSLVWEQLESQSKSYRRLYLSPVGQLNKIAFSALYDGQEYLINRHDIRVIAHPAGLLETRDLNMDPEERMVLAGGMNFNAFTDRENRNLSGNTLRKPWSYLPGTLEEVNSIGEVAQKHNLKSELYTDTAFGEWTMRTLGNRPPFVLHLATHGYYRPDINTSGEGNANFMHNPMADAGLVLSGGNAGWTGVRPAGPDDGILTGSEIASLDLQGIRLVTLSACETGLGEILGYEGVYGLNRAFKLAGANFIITSLWEVPDEATSQFMKRFYSYWFSGEALGTAFNHAQRDMSQIYDPWMWGGFILIQ